MQDLLPHPKLSLPLGRVVLSSPRRTALLFVH